MIRCDHCSWHYPAPQALSPEEQKEQLIRCPRCGHRWRHHSHHLQKCWALILSALILFIPANVYPITTLTYLGRRTGDTIFSGVLSLIDEGMLPIAIIVFTASIIIPLAKICAMLLILSCVQFRLSIVSALSLMRLYRVVDRIGRWSILDLFVISLMISLMNMGQLATFVPGPAATAFAGVVLLSVWGTEIFDTRLLWFDEQECL